MLTLLLSHLRLLTGNDGRKEVPAWQTKALWQVETAGAAVAIDLHAVAQQLN